MSYTELLAKFGLIPKEVSSQFNNWGFPQPEAQEVPDVPPEAIVTALRERAEGQEATEIRETDLDILPEYTATRQSGKLHLVIRSLNTEVLNEGDIKITFGRTKRGDYIIPWTAEAITEYMVDPDSYLQDGRRRIRFKNVHEVWYGESKTFMVATPEEQDDHEG
jgi:hypothetical protein